MYCVVNFRISGSFQFLTPVYFTRDPEIIRQIAIKDFDHFQDHRSFMDSDTQDLFGNSLLFLTGQKWRDMRATLSPAFTGSKMRLMFDLVTECMDTMAQHFIKLAQNGERIECEMKELFSRNGNDVIASCAFGVQINSFEQRDNEFFMVGKRLLKFSMLKFALIRVFPKLMTKLNVNFISNDVSSYFRSIMLDTMAYREKNNIYRPDMINTMMQVRKGDLNSGEKENENVDSVGFATVEESHVGKKLIKREWNDNELLAQCFIFFIAGFDSGSTVLATITYELALNQDVQEKLYNEILQMNNTLDGKRITYDTLSKLKYLDQVVSESLRKWTPLAITDRKCIKDYTYDDGELKFVIEKGISVNIPINALHYDPKYFPEPHKFNPDRFSDENKGKIIPGTYIPFGIGPRNCIGKKLLYTIYLNNRHHRLSYTFRFAVCIDASEGCYFLPNITFQICSQ